LPSGIDQVCEEFEAPAPSPCGGSAAAVVAAIAASLVVMVGRHSSAWPEGADAAASAEVLRARLLALADDDVTVVGAVLAATRSGRRGDGGADLVAALLRSSEVPLEIAERAAEVAVLARVAARAGKPPMRADAAAAATLAASAAAVAVAIVAGNLTAPQLADSERDVARIREAASVALERAGV
jgi:formiminotetrahydrofolate cyclodeaminase